MKAEELKGRLWTFDAPPSDGCRVVCHGRQAASPLAAWREGWVYCEDCGEHAALVCPACEERHDHVWAKTFHVEQGGER